MSIPEVTMDGLYESGVRYLCFDEEGMTGWDGIPDIVCYNFNGQKIWTEPIGGGANLLMDSCGRQSACLRDVLFPVITSEVKHKIVKVRCANT